MAHLVETAMIFKASLSGSLSGNSYDFFRASLSGNGYDFLGLH